MKTYKLIEYSYTLKDDNNQEINVDSYGKDWFVIDYTDGVVITVDKLLDLGKEFEHITTHTYTKDNKPYQLYFQKFNDENNTYSIDSYISDWVDEASYEIKSDYTFGEEDEIRDKYQNGFYSSYVLETDDRNLATDTMVDLSRGNTKIKQQNKNQSNQFTR